MPTSQPIPEISIRSATNNDAPEILACLQAAFAPYRNSYTPAAYLDTVLTPESLQDRLARRQVFVAENSSGQVVGTIACQVICQGEGHLRGMAVLPACQGRGIAAQLLTHAEAELRRQHCIRIPLDTTEPLERAMCFYEKFGFRRSGKITRFLRHAPLRIPKAPAAKRVAPALRPEDLSTAVLSCLARFSRLFGNSFRSNTYKKHRGRGHCFSRAFRLPGRLAQMGTRVNQEADRRTQTEPHRG